MALRVLFTPPAAGPENLALDLALLSSVSRKEAPPTLRLYRWSGLWVSVGYAQSFREAVNLDACQEAGAGIVRRPTGGKALLHGRDLTYSLVLGGSHPLARANIARSYVQLSKVLVDALALVGIQGALARREPEENRSAMACFDEHRVETVSVAGRKLIGSAQARREGALLQHGSVPLTNDYELLSRLFCPNGTPLSDFSTAHRTRVTSLAQAAPGLHPEDFAAALVAAFARFFGGAYAGEVSSDEERLAAGLAGSLETMPARRE